MKYLTILIAFSIFTISGYSQTKNYWSIGGEMLFSYGNISDNGADASSTLRWAPVVNIQQRYNIDFNENLGIFTGSFIHNVGYIYDDYQDRTLDPEVFGNPHKKKFRSYNFGVPLGVKIGDLENLFFYGGYEVEFAFHYKEKTFDGDDKTNTTTGWFSDRQEIFQHGFFVGVQLPYDLNIKFKYYLSEFHNQDYTDNDGIKPYDGLNTNVFYFSLGYNLSFK